MLSAADEVINVFLTCVWEENISVLPYCNSKNKNKNITAIPKNKELGFVDTWHISLDL